MESFEEKWESYYLKYRREIIALALSLTQSLEDSNDISQEVFIKFYRVLKKGKKIEDPKNYLYKATIRKCIDFKRSFWKKIFKKKSDLKMNLEFHGNGKFELLKEMIKKLPRMQKISISLRFYSEMQINEISKLLGISESSVKTHLKRGLLKLRKMLEEKNETY